MQLQTSQIHWKDIIYDPYLNEGTLFTQSKNSIQTTSNLNLNIHL